MKTKALLLTAALAAAASTSMAQVYSVNAVGYVNVTLKKGYNLIANPLKNGGNTLIEILPANCGLPEDTFVITWDSAIGGTGGVNPESPFFFPGAGWEPAGSPIPPGKAFFLYIDPTTASQESYTVTFVGEVPTGSLSTAISGGNRYNAIASQVPQAGKVTTDLGLQAVQDDMLLVWDKNANPPRFNSTAFFYDDGIGWNDLNNVVEPTVGVGEGFFLFRTAAGPNAWTRTFNINP